MKLVERDTIVDYQSYSDVRAEVRASIFEIKRPRRVHLGEHLTFLFENADTMRYQVHEMLRAEKIVREKDIQQEIDTYNELLGGPGELGCTLRIEMVGGADRDAKLRSWMDLVDGLFLRLEDGKTVGATYDSRQIGEDRLSSVQYLKFDTGGRNPVGVGCCHADPLIGQEVLLTTDQRAALEADLHSA